MPIVAVRHHDERYPDGQAGDRYDEAMTRFLAWTASNARHLDDGTLESRLQEGRLPDAPDINAFVDRVAAGAAMEFTVYAIPGNLATTTTNIKPTAIDPGKGTVVRFVSEPGVFGIRYSSNLRAQTLGYTLRSDDGRLIVEIYRFDREPRSLAGMSQQEELNYDYAQSLYRVLESVILTLGVWEADRDDPPGFGSFHRRYYGANYIGGSASRGGWFRDIAELLVGPRETINGNNALLYIDSPSISAHGN